MVSSLRLPLSGVQVTYAEVRDPLGGFGVMSVDPQHFHPWGTWRHQTVPERGVGNEANGSLDGSEPMGLATQFLST